MPVAGFDNVNGISRMVGVERVKDPISAVALARSSSVLLKNVRVGRGMPPKVRSVAYSKVGPKGLWCAF